MSAKKQALRARREAAAQEKAFKARAVKVGAFAALFTALAGPMAAVPLEDPRKPRAAAAWTPTPKDPPADTKSRQLDPVMYRTHASIEAGDDLYVRKAKGSHFGELGSRYRDRIRGLEALLVSLGVKPTPRQIKRILRGQWPPQLERWLDQKTKSAEASA